MPSSLAFKLFKSRTYGRITERQRDAGFMCSRFRVLALTRNFMYFFPTEAAEAKTLLGSSESILRICREGLVCGRKVSWQAKLVFPPWATEENVSQARFS